MFGNGEPNNNDEAMEPRLRSLSASVYQQNPVALEAESSIEFITRYHF